MSGFPEDLFSFLSELKENNRKDWFDDHKKRYEGLKKALLVWMDALIVEMRKADPTLPEMEARQCLFRINRDVRFSADKSPYKTHFGLYMSRGGRKWPGAGYYLHLGPDEQFLAAGTWMPEPEYLRNIRQEIDYCQEEYLDLVGNLHEQGFVMIEEGQLSRPPKGYDKEHPALHYLRQKHFVFTQKFQPESFSQPEIFEEVHGFVAQTAPYIQFLNRCLPEAHQGI